MIRRWIAPGASVVVLACFPGESDLTGEKVQLTIPRGATLAAAADSLHAYNLISSPTRFRLYAKITGRERAVQAGTYDIPRGASMRQILAILVAGRPAEERLVVLEGLTLREVADTVHKQLGIPAESIVVAASDSALRVQLQVSGLTLEGYLYPSTYLVPVGADARDVVQQLTEEFTRRWQRRWTAQLDALRMSRHEIVILASIIEGEVRYAPDRPYVSSVYHNRLRRGMRLQADPTVAYALGRRRRLYEKDYLIRSPYNTYQVDGLPPGPIGQPSEESIRAALYPATSPFLYFVARADGQHVFSETYAEHLRAIREIRGRN